MDTDVSHEVQKLFNAVHERLDALEEKAGLKKEEETSTTGEDTAGPGLDVYKVPPSASTEVKSPSDPPEVDHTAGVVV